MVQSDEGYIQGVIKGCGSDGQECLILPGEKWGEVSDQDDGDADGDDEEEDDGAAISDIRCLPCARHLVGALHSLTPLLHTTTL